jgi:hypothetical protein
MPIDDTTGSIAIAQVLDLAPARQCAARAEDVIFLLGHGMPVLSCLSRPIEGRALYATGPLGVSTWQEVTASFPWLPVCSNGAYFILFFCSGVFCVFNLMFVCACLCVCAPQLLVCLYFCVCVQNQEDEECDESQTPLDMSVADVRHWYVDMVQESWRLETILDLIQEYGKQHCLVLAITKTRKKVDEIVSYLTGNNIVRSLSYFRFLYV